MENKSALDRLKEIEAERYQIEKTLTDEAVVEFPLFIAWKAGYKFKVLSINECVRVTATEVAHEQYSGSVTCSGWIWYIKMETELITREEFESARTETLKKLSEI